MKTSTTLSNSATACKAFLVLLRLVIGWHLLYEGLYKLDAYNTDQPWSAWQFLAQAEGPLGQPFRSLVLQEPADVAYDREVIGDQWLTLLERFNTYYGVTPDQRDSAAGELRFVEDRLKRKFFEDPDLRQALQQYRDDISKPTGSLTSGEQKRLAKNRRMLNARLGELRGNYQYQLQVLLTPAQKARGDWMVNSGCVGWINRLVIWGLIASGGCLLVGLFSRFSAVIAALMLLLFYLAMPPLPGLTGTAVGSSHYLYVNNNLIEAVALFMLATTNSGRWLGIDAVLSPVLETSRRSRRGKQPSANTENSSENMG
jgi:uncharacterized membrane protein YphA (DoxX/SURF4 family)